MSDTRFKFNDTILSQGLFVNANSSHFLKNDSFSLAPYEKELWEFISTEGHRAVPIICRDRNQKLAARDSAKLSMDKMLAFIKAKDGIRVREVMRDCVNLLLKFALGEELYALLEDSYRPYLKLINSPVNELTDAEKDLIQTASNAFKEKGVFAGLLKP